MQQTIARLETENASLKAERDHLRDKLESAQVALVAVEGLATGTLTLVGRTADKS